MSASASDVARRVVHSTPFMRTIPQAAKAFGPEVLQTLMARVAAAVLGFLATLLLARTLGPDGQGAYALVLTVGAIGIQLGNVGLHAANTYFVAKDRALFPTLFGNSIAAAFVIGGIAAAIVALLARSVLDLPTLRGWILLLAAAWIPLGLLYTFSHNLLLGTRDLFAYNSADVAVRALTLLSFGLLAITGIHAVGYWVSTTFLSLFVAALWLLIRCRSALTAPVRISTSTFLRTFSYGIRAYLAALFAFLVLRLDLLMVEHYLGSEQTGYYSIAVIMADIIYLFPLVIGTLLFPTLAALNDRGEQREQLRKASSQVLAVVIPLALLGGLLGSSTVRLLFGTAFLPTVDAFVWLLPAIVMLSIATLIMNYLAARGMPPITVYLPLVALIVNVIANTILIPAVGIVGAALSSVVAYGILLTGSLVYLALEPR